jgi:hypothetical protein
MYYYRNIMIAIIKKVGRQILLYKKADTNIPITLFRKMYYLSRGKNIDVNSNTLLRGLKNIHVKGQLRIGLNYVGFLNKYDRTYLNINGTLEILNSVSIGKGSRLYICKNAYCVLDNCYLTGNVTLIISKGLSIGAGSAISWGCEFIDNNWHSIKYEGRRGQNEDFISIGKHTWIGSHVKILRGVRIADNSVVAANSVVTGIFDEPSVLIAGIPAKIIRRNVNWK